MCPKAVSQRGQSSVEWLALVGLVAIALGTLAWGTGVRVPGTPVAAAVAERLICAVRLSDSCRSDPQLYAEYGAVAELVRLHAPTISYERGMTAMPVDFRSCRVSGCAQGPLTGRVAQTLGGRKAVAFTHVIDCRRPGEGDTEADCSGARADRVYIQYWLYYPSSATAEGRAPVNGLVRATSAAVGIPSFHRDDWEGYQIRIGPDGSVDSRANSHHGYNGAGGALNWGSDAGGLPGARPANRAVEALGLRARAGWTRSTGRLYVSGGSHAGHTSEFEVRREVAKRLAELSLSERADAPTGRFAAMERRRRLGAETRRIELALFGPGARITPRGSLTLLPIEPLRGSKARFAVTPPWLKRVYLDPEYDGTD